PRIDPFLRGGLLSPRRGPCHNLGRSLNRLAITGAGMPRERQSMRLLVVIVSYRVTDLAIDCLHSLSGEIGRVPGTRVALCENGTGGDAADRFRRAIDENGWNSWVDLTVIYPNRGFTGGNNAVIRPALESADPPEYVLLLNADTIVKEHALDALVT